MRRTSVCASLLGVLCFGVMGCGQLLSLGLGIGEDEAPTEPATSPPTPTAEREAEESQEVDAGAPPPDPPLEDPANGSGPPPRRCGVTKPFGEPVALKSNVPGLTSVRMSLAGMGIVALKPVRKGGGQDDVEGDTQLRFAELDGETLKGAPPNDIGRNIETAADEDHPTLSAGALALVFQRERDLYLARRNDANSAFGDPMRVKHGLGDITAGEPYLVGPHLYFSRLSADGKKDVWMGLLGVATGTLTKATLVLFSSKEELGHPVVSSDELEIFYASRSAKGPLRIFHATRDTPKDAFRDPKQLPTSAGELEEHPTWLSYDGCQLYVVRQLETGPVLLRLQRK